MTRPTLQEIAAMPFPASQTAMRKHYDPSWGRVGEDGKPKWRVQVEYSYTETGSDTFEVEAFDKQEADNAARVQCEEENDYHDGFEIESVRVLECLDEQAD